VREGCEKIQRYGKKENVDGKSIDDETLCLDRIKDEINTVKVDIKEARQALYAYYGKDKSADA
jgi:osomolarity two-component system phosphorelay intermediate protein YPD1